MATWEGGDPACGHLKNTRFSNKTKLRDITSDKFTEENIGKGTPYNDTCAKCGAIRHDAGIGLEPTPEEWVDNMVSVFREVWRVLRDDGTCWVNIGDSYCANVGQGFKPDGGTQRGTLGNTNPFKHPTKAKDLIGMPWRLAFALQADGWYLRSDIIWHKPNPMPESVTDRPTKAHEYVFLLSKNKRYFYDATAIREERLDPADDYRRMSKAASYTTKKNSDRQDGGSGFDGWNPVSSLVGRNKRTVWTIATAPYSGAHFATFPPKLIEPMVRAGTSEHGVCPECGSPWKRITELTPEYAQLLGKSWHDHSNDMTDGNRQYKSHPSQVPQKHITTGFAPTCSHEHEPIPATVLDIFVGSGTTVQVARSLGRRGIGIDLSLEYLKLARQRLELDKLDDWGKGIKDEAVYDELPLFNVS